eukprot:3251228-Pyramimonas_sp.AAC.2
MLQPRGFPTNPTNQEWLPNESSGFTTNLTNQEWLPNELDQSGVDRHQHTTRGGGPCASPPISGIWHTSFWSYAP